MTNDGKPSSYTELAMVLDILPTLCKENRRRKRLSMRNAATESGITASSIKRLEDGSDYSARTAVLLLHWLET